MYNNRKVQFKGMNDMLPMHLQLCGVAVQLLIYKFERGKFVDVTKNFPAFLYNDIEQHKETLKHYVTDTGFACPENIGDDTQ